jgi:hypothetical protein
VATDVDCVPRVLGAAVLIAAEFGLAQAVGLPQFLSEMLLDLSVEPNEVVIGQSVTGVDVMEDVHHLWQQRLSNGENPVFPAQNVCGITFANQCEWL